MAGSVKKLIYSNRAALLVGWHKGNDLNGWEIAFDIVVGWRPHTGVAMFGWGWDDHVPLRPWPQFWLNRLTPKGHRTNGAAWFGFFTTMGS